MSNSPLKVSFRMSSGFLIIREDFLVGKLGSSSGQFSIKLLTNSKIKFSEDVLNIKSTSSYFL